MLQIRFCALARAVGAIFVGPPLSLAATLNVPADYPTIQSCIDAAVSGVDECAVAPGTYHETINFFGKALTLRGSGGESVTTIDATGLAASVVTCANGEGPDTVLEGFTITGGTGTTVGVRKYGGGIYIFSSSPTVTNCTFRGNTVNFYGGGMYNVANSNPTVTHCTFIGNSAWQGGAMYNDVSSPTVTDCAFIANTVGAGGAGMFNLIGSPTVTHCTFSGNTAVYSGGGIHNQFSNADVANCTFSENTGNYGGGMYNDNSDPTVADCQFSGNRTLYGGGMFNVSSAPTATNCTFSANLAGAFGGGMYNQGGAPKATNCVFSANTAGNGGGGMINLGGSPSLINCTFSGNTSTSDGGGMLNLDGSPAVTNCILWGDSPNELVNGTKSIPTISFSDVQGGLPVGAIDGGGNIDLDPMFVRPPDPGPDGTWDGMDDDYGDLRLQPASPCINAGEPAFAPQPGETDLDGHARVLCGPVDMGAYEFGIGDYDCNRTVNLSDFSAWPGCMTGPSAAELRMANSQERMTSPLASLHLASRRIGNGQLEIGNRQLAINCGAFDFDGDSDVDLQDYSLFSQVFTGP